MNEQERADLQAQYPGWNIRRPAAMRCMVATRIDRFLTDQEIFAGLNRDDPRRGHTHPPERSPGHPTQDRTLPVTLLGAIGVLLLATFALTMLITFVTMAIRDALHQNDDLMSAMSCIRFSHGLGDPPILR